MFSETMSRKYLWVITEIMNERIDILSEATFRDPVSLLKGGLLWPSLSAIDRTDDHTRPSILLTVSF